MMVYIGPYTPWWVSRIHKNYMDKKYDYDWEKSNTTFEKILEKLEDALQWMYSNTANIIFGKMKRKIKVRVDEYDVWSMDHTLSYIILPMLKKLQKAKHGAPYVDDEDVPEHLRSTAAEPKENEWDTDSNHFKRWDWIMEQMIWSFEQQLDDDADKNYYDPYEPDEPVEPAMSYSVINKDGTTTEKTCNWDTEDWRRERGKYNNEKRKAYEERKQFGFTMFGKYFQSLWD
jgi:hypothetical protein